MSARASLPSMYIPHGSGPCFFMQGPMRAAFSTVEEFLKSVAATLPYAPSAILIATAHWETRVPTFTGGSRPGLIYDYGGFPPHTYELTYPAPGDRALATRASQLLKEAGIDNEVDENHGWDHGVFIPLKVMFPDADIPVVAMSIQSDLDPAAHIAIGRALAPLRHDGVLIVGSGMSTHNQMTVRGPAGKAASARFDRWLDGAFAGDGDYRAKRLSTWASAPSARDNHPREEHLIPLMVAAGAGGDSPARKIMSGLVVETTVSAWAFD